MSIWKMMQDPVYGPKMFELMRESLNKFMSDVLANSIDQGVITEDQAEAIWEIFATVITPNEPPPQSGGGFCVPGAGGGLTRAGNRGRLWGAEGGGEGPRACPPCCELRVRGGTWVQTRVALAYGPSRHLS